MNFSFWPILAQFHKTAEKIGDDDPSLPEIPDADVNELVVTDADVNELRRNPNARSKDQTKQPKLIAFQRCLYHPPESRSQRWYATLKGVSINCVRRTTGEGEGGEGWGGLKKTGQLLKKRQCPAGQTRGVGLGKNRTLRKKFTVSSFFLRIFQSLSPEFWKKIAY